MGTVPSPTGCTHCLHLAVIYILLFPKAPTFSYAVAIQGFKKAEENRLLRVPQPKPAELDKKLGTSIHLSACIFSVISKTRFPVVSAPVYSFLPFLFVAEPTPFLCYEIVNTSPILCWPNLLGMLQRPSAVPKYYKIPT